MTLLVGDILESAGSSS